MRHLGGVPIAAFETPVPDPGEYGLYVNSIVEPRLIVDGSGVKPLPAIMDSPFEDINLPPGTYIYIDTLSLPATAGRWAFNHSIHYSVTGATQQTVFWGLFQGSAAWEWCTATITRNHDTGGTETTWNTVADGGSIIEGARVSTGGGYFVQIEGVLSFPQTGNLLLACNAGGADVTISQASTITLTPLTA
ncbi:hypothetical protein [Planomonospora algeriensis]